MTKKPLTIMDGKFANTKLIQDALDVLALALTDHNHRWSVKERKLYERATKEVKKIGGNYD